MTSVSLLSSAMERLDLVLLGKTAAGIKDLSDGVEQLKTELHRIVAFLSDTDATKNISAEINRSVTELAYDIEDAVDSFVRREGSSIIQMEKGRCLFKCCSRERSFLENLHILMRTRIDELIDKIVGANLGSKSRDSASEPPRRYRQQFYENRAPSPVGMEKYTVKLKNILVGRESRLSVIPICGMGGMGKTTLARSIYNDPLLIAHFDCRAWAIVSMGFQARDILETILLNLASHQTKDVIAAMETMALMEKLYKTLKARRYLIVLDDVWSAEAWDTLRSAFPDNCNGSRIVITTRLMNVAQYASTNSATVLEMELLSPYQSWELLLVASGLQKGQAIQLNPEMREIGKQIVKYCGGIPLATTIIGGSLLGMNLRDSKAMLHELQGRQNFGTGLGNVFAGLWDVFTLSYTYLPFFLKPCFLYLGHFPADQPILVDKLYLLWVAEGLITKRMETRTEELILEEILELAENTLSELVDRSLVTVLEKEDLSGRLISCRVHDLIRELCISKGEQEEFFEVIDFVHASKLSSSTCRLAIYLDKFKYTNDVLLDVNKAKRIRSILFFDTVQSMLNPTWPTGVSDLTEFRQTRVLDFEGVDFEVKKLPRGIEKLIYLRHLSFQGCNLQEFPSSFSNFPFLETLDLRVIVSCIMTIPNILSKLLSLRRLYFPLAFQTYRNEKLKLDSLKKLGVLENFHAGFCDAEDLLQLENLYALTGIVDGDNLDLEKIISSINKMKFISRLSLVVKSFDCYSKGRLLVVEKLLKCSAIHALDIEGHLGALPHDIVFGPSFTEMVFNGSEFSDDPMPILGKLPNLKSLILCDDAFIGTKLVCRELGFPQLKSLKLATLQSLTKLEVEGDSAMPNLTILIIEQCYKLEMPHELIKSPTLQKLMIGSMPKYFQQQVNNLVRKQKKPGGEELSVKFYDC